MTVDRPLRPTRRAALVGGAVLLATTGCDLVGDRPGTDPDPSDSPGTSGSDASPDADPDESLVDEVRAEIATAAAVVLAAGRGRPSVSRRVGDYRRLHDRHLAALPGETGRVRRVRVAGDDAQALRRVTTAENLLQRRLADASVAAESGPLAALLASMSAAVAQLLATGEAT